MENVGVKNSIICCVGIVFLAFSTIAQKKSDQLQSEQTKLERKLAATKQLLDKVKSGTQTSLNELRLIENQVKDREELVQNFDNQIRSAELTISSKDAQIKSLQEKVIRQKNQYRKLLLYAYKHRSQSGKMMYIFSSSNYFEAVKRNAYLKRLAEIQQKQFRIIQQSQGAIKKEIGSIQKEKTKKEQLLSEKVIEKEKILEDKSKKEQTLASLRKDEQKLQEELRASNKQKEVLKRRIKEAIEKEIADAAKAEKKAATAKNDKSAKTDTKTTTSTAKKEVVFTETNDNIILGKNFASNRGKLPWPVTKGSITESYGKNPHPTMANVFTNNNGIDIGAPKNAQVRAVFEGEVTSVLNIPGAGKVVIIKHGNYRTVYSKLQEAYVSVGTKVTTRQSIGALLPDDEGNLSTAHFEIHQVIDGSVQQMNPSLWLGQ